MKIWKWFRLILLSSLLLPVAAEAKEYPRIIKGVLDLSAWNFEQDGSIPLEGEAAFYWDRSMDPNPRVWDRTIEPAYINVNRGWSHSGYPVKGKGTYHIRIQSDHPLKLALGYIWMESEAKVFVNGTLRLAGIKGEDGRLPNPFVKPFGLADEEFRVHDLVIQIENQDFNVGGIIESRNLGLPDAVNETHRQKAMVSAGMFFAILTLAFYNLGLFAMNRKEVTPVLIAVICFCVAGLMSTKEGMLPWIYKSNDKAVWFRIYHLSYYLILPVFWLYLRAAFPAFFSLILVRIAGAVGLIAVGLVLLSPLRIYQGIVNIYHLLNALSFIYVIVQAVRIARGQTIGSMFFTTGVTVASLLSIYELLIYQGVVPRFPAAGFGLLFFCFTQSFILSRRFSETLRQVQRSEVEIRQLNEDLKEKEKARTLFFHNTSHELRTPLNGIIGFVDLIEQGRYGEMNSTARAQLIKVKSLAVSLKQQVNTILDLAKSKQGKLMLKNSQFPLRILVQNSRSLAEGLNLKKAQVQFTLETRDFDPAKLWINDYEKVFTIIRNLIGNAFKFTAVDKPSQVTLRLSLQPDGILVIEVKDTGIGIPASHKDKIFQEFQQVESDARRSYEGTGLGLAMVRDIVNLMNGQISFESEEGQGSTFTVHIPAQTVIHVEQSEIAGEWPGKDASPRVLAPERESVKALENESIARHLILVVDDNEMNCEVVRDILTMEGYEVILAFGGQDALVKLREHHPDLVLLDLMMPEVSGEDVLQAMRSDPDLDNIPVILLTARATEDDRIHGLELGADDYLAKPLIARELILRVHNLLLRIESTRLLEGVEHREKMALMGELLSDLSHELKNIHHADSYGSRNLIEHVQPLLDFFPGLENQGITADILLSPALDMGETQAREQMILVEIKGRPDRHERRLVMYLASIAIPKQHVQGLWRWSKELPAAYRSAWESLLAMLEHVNALSQSSERTQELITAVLDYGRYQKDHSVVDISHVIASSLTFLQARFRRAGIRVENHVQGQAAVASSSDVQQITLNILNNAYDAIKDLGPDQERLVSIAVSEDSEQKLIRLRFVNKGPEIPADVLPRIFERRFTTKGEKGSGLGLYVSRRLAVKNHGDLHAESQDGLTVFELTLRKAG